MPSIRTIGLALAAPCLSVVLGCEPAAPGGTAPGEGALGAPAAPRAVPSSLDTVPALVILDTASTGEAKLLLPSGATVLSNGNVVVSDQWGHSVRFFDPSGNPLRTVGRGGEGPGEFAFPTWLGQCGPDSVFVWDGMQGRMTVMDSAGTIVREYSGGVGSDQRRCARSGTFAVWGQPGRMPTSLSESLATRFSAPLRFEDATGDSVGGVGIVLLGEGWILGSRTQLAITDDRLYVGTADSAFLDVYDLDGEHLGSIPLSITPRAPTEANVERWLDAQMEFLNDTRARERQKQMVRQASRVPEHLPLYTGLAVDPEGVIWVVLSSPGDGETRFQVVGPDGAHLADFRIPAELKLYEVGHDHVLGMIHGPYDTPGIALYRFRRGSS